MGVDLFGRGGSHHLNWQGWCELLELAETFGWQPAGTITNTDPAAMFDILHLPESEECSPLLRRSGYFTNDGNLVTRADAAALANALETAVAHPEQPVVRRFLGIEKSCDKEVLKVALEKAIIHIDDPIVRELPGLDFGPEGVRRWTLDFVNFCRAGRFIIY